VAEIAAANTLLVELRSAIRMFALAVLVVLAVELASVEEVVVLDALERAREDKQKKFFFLFLFFKKAFYILLFFVFFIFPLIHK
jgi:hypothetical protein